MPQKKGYKFTDEHKKKIGLANKGKRRTAEHKLIISEATKKGMHEPNAYKRLCAGRKRYSQTKEHKTKFAERTSKLWKEHPEKHPNYNMVNVSKNQLRVFEKVKAVFEEAVLEYPIKSEGKNLFIDIALPVQKVAIEYDGGYWHKDKLKEETRDKRLNLLGWTVIHVRSDIKDRNIDYHELDNFFEQHLVSGGGNG